MKLKFLPLILILGTCAALLASPVVAQDTQEFEVTVSSDAFVVELSGSYSHFAISSDVAGGSVRFLQRGRNVSGAFTGWTGLPKGDPNVPTGSGPRPDRADTTMIINSDLSWNVYNDVKAEKLHIYNSNTAVLVIKAKR